MSSHLKDKESFSIFVFKIRHLVLELRVQQKEISKEISENYKILREINSDIYKTRVRINEMD